MPFHVSTTIQQPRLHTGKAQNIPSLHSDHSRSFNLSLTVLKLVPSRVPRTCKVSVATESDIDQQVGAPSRAEAGLSGGRSLTRAASTRDGVLERSLLLRERHGNGAHDLAKSLLVLFAEGVVREDGEIVEIVLFG